MGEKKYEMQKSNGFSGGVRYGIFGAGFTDGIGREHRAYNC